MKIFGLLLFFVTSLQAQIHLTPVDPDVNLKEVPKNVVIDRETPHAIYLRPEKRDEILSKLFPTETAKLDDVDRDILYKSIINYPAEKLFKKYSFINKQNYSKVKDAFK